METVNDLLSASNKEWMAAFKEAHGRSPRILHIGNIANNAYNNARLLNQAGFDCDVICYDYYHTMASPEWEDADFSAKFENENFPDWCNVDLKGFQRPRWFAQGALRTCTHYLIAKRSGSSEAESLWQQLSVQNGMLNNAQSSSVSRSLWMSRLVCFGSRLKRLATVLIVGQRSEISLITFRLLKPRVPSQLLKLAIVVTSVLFFLVRVMGWPFKGLINRQNKRIEHQFCRVLDSWKEEFPDRNDVLSRGDLLPYANVIEIWSALLKRYDFIIGYSTDPLIPMLVDRPYFALEHGTIRDIPYERSSIGRLCALSYRKAQHIFVTNFDCLKSAANLAPGRFTVINHPYDEDHGLSITDASAFRGVLLDELDSDFLIFHPTRHDWVPGTGYADKSNDILIRAFIELRRRGLRVGMVCCNWGANVRDSDALLTGAGLARNVKWISPLPITPFERLCRASDVVADQFKLGAFGGVCFKAMAVGAPILTFLNESLLLRQYSEVPPVVNCSSAEEIVSRVEELAFHPGGLKNLGEASRYWMKTYHGKCATVNSQVDQFRRSFLEVAS